MGQSVTTKWNVYPIIENKNKINRGIHFLSLIISHERLKGSERKQSFHYNNPKTNTIAKNEAILLIGLHAVTISIQNKDSYHTNIDWIRMRMFKLLNFCWSNTNTRRRAMIRHGDDLRVYTKIFINVRLSLSLDSKSGIVCQMFHAMGDPQRMRILEQSEMCEPTSLSWSLLIRMPYIDRRKVKITN